MANKDFWHGWKTTAEQCEQIRNGDIAAWNEWYFDNLDRIRRMAYNYARKFGQYQGLEQDMINGVYADLECFKLSEQTPVNSGKTMSQFVYKSFEYVCDGGYAYLYNNNRKMLSGDYKVRYTSIDAPIYGKRSKRDNDGVCVADILTADEPEAATPDNTEIYIIQVCKLLKQYPKMLQFYELYMRGFDNVEIAEFMGITQSNVSHYLQRLGKRLFKLKGDILPIIERYGEIDCTRFYGMGRQERRTRGKNAPKTDEMTDYEYKHMYGASALWKRNNAEKRKEYNREYYARRKTETHAADMGADGSSLRRRAHDCGMSGADSVYTQLSHTLYHNIWECEQTKKHNMLCIPCFLGGGDGGIRTHEPLQAT